MSNADHLGTWIILAAVGVFCGVYTVRGIRDAIRHEKAKRRQLFADIDHALDALEASINGEPMTPWLIDRTVEEESQYLATEWWLINRNQP